MQAPHLCRPIAIYGDSYTERTGMFFCAQQ
jgi:hypothetical protein